MKLVGTRAAAEALGISPHLLRRASNEGKIPFVEVGKKRLYDVDMARSELLREMTAKLSKDMRASHSSAVSS